MIFYGVFFNTRNIDGNPFDSAIILLIRCIFISHNSSG